MDREKIISKLEKEAQRTYLIKTTVFQNGEKVSEEINTHREPCVRIPIEMADKILALLKEQEAVVPKYNARTNWYECGACHYSMTSGMHCRSELIPATKVRYCANCGFPVNWEGR